MSTTEHTHDTVDSDTVSSELAAGHVAFPSDLREDILTAIDDEAPATQPAYQLAQLNTARFLHPMDHPDMAGFVEMLDPVNHQADSAPGFVWRLTDEGSNNATSIEYYDDPLLLVNISVWADVDALRSFVYQSEHVAMVKRKAEWAESMKTRHIVLWWVPAGHEPTVAEADERLKLLEANGPTPDAFTFAQSFPPPDS